ncbi:MAG: OmpA family protein [candidate division WOR-3 bacterium]|nr:OmpA family protein [candidate division WOR-3 bacterium]MDH5683214.1 OmpA family protein [candidate division WOR-3 bacterium]
MKDTAKILILFISLVFLFGSFGCAKKVVKQEEPIPPPIVVEPEVPEVEEVVKPVLNLATIYFDFDRSDIRMGDATILKGNSQQLKGNPMVNITVEGHCCPLGTSEYNMALGWRRANSAQDYLVKLGLSKDRISTISYGEEKLVTAIEAEYWKNRRCEFKLK